MRGSSTGHQGEVGRQHELKIWPAWFDAVVSGDKRAEVRKWDRAFRVGDCLLLREWDPKTGDYTGAYCTAEVRHIVPPKDSIGMQSGYGLLSIVVTGADTRRGEEAEAWP